MPVRKFTDEQEQEICRRYEAGESSVSIGKTLGVKDGTICSVLRRGGIKLRSRTAASKGRRRPLRHKLTSEQEQEVCRRYLAGENTVELGEIFKVTSTTVIRILKFNSVDRRHRGEVNRCLSPEQEQKVCRRYEDGESIPELSKDFGVSNNCIGGVLKRNNVKTRSFSQARGGIQPDQWSEVCRRYLEGENTPAIAEAFGVSGVHVTDILRRSGVTLRSPGESSRVLTHKQGIEVCHRYEAGENSVQLAEVYSVTSGTICSALKRNGIELRGSRFEFGDSIQHVLDGTGHHTHTRDCELYLFSLARHTTHCKVGITFDTDTRTDEEYGEEVLRLVFSTRTEAFMLEQAILDATRGNADCPDDLIGWGGHTEVRAMPADDMVPIILNLQQEMEELGMWEFAARYVPMTAAQRATCQQRALQPAAV